MGETAWSAVDDYIGEKLLGSDAALEAALAGNAAAGLPPIDVSPAQGKLLYLIARLGGARRVLEIGTLGGYSTIWLARAVGAEGRVVTLEIDPDHAEVAQANLERAGLAERVDIRVGRAAETLERMREAGEAPFDLSFIDADKPNNAVYLRHALALSRPGSVIICDNVVREGRVLDPNSGDAMVEGTRALFDALASEPRLTATAIQTVGRKKWDGLAIAIVEDAL